MLLECQMYVQGIINLSNTFEMRFFVRIPGNFLNLFKLSLTLILSNPLKMSENTVDSFIWKYIIVYRIIFINGIKELCAIIYK